MLVNLELALAIVIAIATVAAGLYAIYRLGPGMTSRRLRCPETGRHAEIAVVREEGTFGSLLERDVVACSLLPGGLPDCAKRCLKA